MAAGLRRAALLGSVSLLAVAALAPAERAFAGQLPQAAFQTYDPSTASGILPGPFSLYQVPLSMLQPTQMNVGFAEIGKKIAGWDLLPQTNAAAITATKLTDIEPVVIGPGGVLYLTDGHHTFLSLLLSTLGLSAQGGAQNPSVFVDVIANYSNLTPAQFWAKMQASNFLLPLNNGAVQSVDPLTGAPIPSSFLGMTGDVYRGLEYSILKNKSSVLFPTAATITGVAGASTPGLDKTAAFYSDFIWAQAYRSANGGLGLPYLSPGDVAISTQWNLNGNNTVNLPGASVTKVAQLPGYILPSSLTISSGISDATLSTGVLAGDGSFTGLRGWTLGTVTIGSSAPGFIMQLGADNNKSTVTLSGVNTYNGGTTILAGILAITGDASLGAASPTGAVIDPTNIAASIAANNGIVFNSLSEGGGTLRISPTTTATLASPFVLNRPIAVDGETATLDPNRNVVKLTGEIISLGGGGTGIGNATGVSDLTIKDLSTQADGTVILAPAGGSNPYFYGNWIISAGTFQASSDAALGNTTGPSYSIGQIDLDGGTFQAGARFDSVRTMTVTGKSKFDTNGFSTSFAQLTDAMRNLTITNSSSGTSGAVAFGSFEVGGVLELTVDKGSGTGTAVTFTNGIIRDPNAMLLLNAASGSALGSTAKVLSSGASTALTNGIVAPWIITDVGGGANNAYDFATYSANGYTAFTSYTTSINPTDTISVVKTGDKAGTLALTADRTFYALDLSRGATITGAYTLTVGDGTNPAGLIMNGTNGNPLTISTSKLAFGASEGLIYIAGSQTSPTGTANVINAQITGSGGLTIGGVGMLTIGTATAETGAVVINSGTLNLTAADALKSSSGVLLQNTKNLAQAALVFNQSQSLSGLNSTGTNSVVIIDSSGTGGGSAAPRLTIDTTSQTSTLSSAIIQAGSNQDPTAGAISKGTFVATGNAVSGIITKNGTGLLDLSGMGKGTLNLVSGSSIVVNGGQLRVGASIFTNPNAIVLNNASELQFAQNGGGVFGGAISGSGMVHLIGGTLKLTGTANSWSGGTLVEAGSTLSLTTANVSSGNANIASAGGYVVFDQATSGTYSGVISDGKQMGYGALASGILVKDDSTGASAGNVTLGAVQTYTGGTFVEAGTLTLGVANTIAASAGVDLGRIGGTAAGQTAPNTATLALAADNTIQGLKSEAGNVTAVQLGGNTLTINTVAGTQWSFGGSISGSGSLVVGGLGAQILTGANTFTGSTTVNGMLGVSGALAGAVQVNGGGVLFGNGTVGATSVASGGVLAPSVIVSGAATLTVNGSLAFQSGALYMVGVAPASATQVAASGTATLGGTVQATFASGAYTQLPKSYTILSAANVSGTFAGLSTANMPAALSASLGYTPTGVTLNLTSGLGRLAGLNGNQAAVGNAIDAAFNGSSGGVSGGFATLLGLSAAALPGALSQASGQPGASQQQSALIAATQFMSTLTDMGLPGRGSATGGVTAYSDDPGEAYAYAPRGGAEREAYAAIPTKALRRVDMFTPAWSVWGAGYGASSTTNGNAVVGSNTTTSTLWGFASGADYQVARDLVIGFALAGGASAFSLANGLGSGRADMFQAGGFARQQFGAAYLTGALAYTWQDVTTDRTVTIAGADHLRGRFNADAFSGRAEAGYRVLTPWLGVTPYAAVQATMFMLPGYGEQAVSGTSTFALAYASKSTTATRSELGLRFDRSLVLTDGILVLRGRAAWAHDYNPDASVTATFQNLGAASFVVNGATPARDAALTTVSAEKVWAGGFSLGATFEGEFSNTTRSYAGKGIARFTW